MLGSVQPDFTYGISTSFRYRGFDFFVALQGSHGNKVYNHLRRYLETPTDSYNVSAALLDSWTEDNPSNVLPGLNNMADDRYYGYLDSRYIEDASFLRFKNLTLKCIEELVESLSVKDGNMPHSRIPGNMPCADTRKGHERYVWYNPSGKQRMFLSKSLAVRDGEYPLPGIIYDTNASASMFTLLRTKSRRRAACRTKPRCSTLPR